MTNPDVTLADLTAAVLHLSQAHRHCIAMQARTHHEGVGMTLLARAVEDLHATRNRLRGELHRLAGYASVPVRRAARSRVHLHLHRFTTGGIDGADELLT